MGGRAGCRICAIAERRVSARSDSRPSATRTGGSRTSRRSRTPNSGRRRSMRRVNEDTLKTVAYGDAANRVVVLNGRFCAELSRVNGLPHGMRVVAPGGGGHRARRHRPALSRAARGIRDEQRSPRSIPRWPSTALYVHIPRRRCGRAADSSLFVSVPGSGAAPMMSNVRTLIVAGDRSQVRIVETYAGPQAAATSPTR